MANHDIFNKPMPLLVPEDRGSDKKNLAAPQQGKFGVVERPRDLGGEPGAKSGKDAPAKNSKSDRPAPTATPQGPKRGLAPHNQEPLHNEALPAWRNPYFNRDVEQTAAPNLRARPQAALRGEESAVDLKKIVLPGHDGAPDPHQLFAALSRMGQLDAAELSLSSMVARQHDLLNQPQTKIEDIQARQARLEIMVQMRREALLRMSTLGPDRPARSRTLIKAMLADDPQTPSSHDMQTEGSELVQQTSQQAERMHVRLKKVIKSKS